MNRTPYLIDPDLTIYQGDALDVLRAHAAERLGQQSLLTELA